MSDVDQGLTNIEHGRMRGLDGEQTFKSVASSSQETLHLGYWSTRYSWQTTEHVSRWEVRSGYLSDFALIRPDDSPNIDFRDRQSVVAFGEERAMRELFTAMVMTP